MRFALYGNAIGWRPSASWCRTVGISDITHNKHVTWPSALFKFADANGYLTPDVDLGKLRRKVKGRKGGKRLPWAEHDLRTLVSGPVWTGCKGLWNRLTPGDVVFHEGMYWGLPLVVCTGGRSEEPAGLMLADVYDEAEIPYIHFRDNAYRQLKNGQSDRRVPISPAYPARLPRSRPRDPSAPR